MKLIENEAVEKLVARQKATGKALAVILAGHNGSGKSTLWYEQLAERFRIPLVNADRMIMSILPDMGSGQPLPQWAVDIRDRDTSWMKVARNGVEAFVAQAMTAKVPFAMETVFSHWKERDGAPGTFESKIDKIRELQQAGYFVLLIFVGLESDQVSIARVATRVSSGGHSVDGGKLVTRFPRTQKAIAHAITVADAAILTDNSRHRKYAFTVCRVQMVDDVMFDIRQRRGRKPREILAWLDRVCPQACSK